MDIPFKTLHHNNSLASFSFPTLSSNLFSLLNKRLFHHVPKAGKSSHLEKKTGERTHEWGQLAKKCMPRFDPSPATSPTSKAYARHAPRPKRLGNQQHPPEKFEKNPPVLVKPSSWQVPLFFWGKPGVGSICYLTYCLGSQIHSELEDSWFYQGTHKSHNAIGWCFKRGFFTKNELQYGKCVNRLQAE